MVYLAFVRVVKRGLVPYPITSGLIPQALNHPGPILWRSIGPVLYDNSTAILASPPPSPLPPTVRRSHFQSLTPFNLIHHLPGPLKLPMSPTILLPTSPPPPPQPPPQTVVSVSTAKQRSYRPTTDRTSTISIAPTTAQFTSERRKGVEGTVIFYVSHIKNDTTHTHLIDAFRIMYWYQTLVSPFGDLSSPSTIHLQKNENTKKNNNKNREAHYCSYTYANRALSEALGTTERPHELSKCILQRCIYFV